MCSLQEKIDLLSKLVEEENNDKGMPFATAYIRSEKYLKRIEMSEEEYIKFLQQAYRDKYIGIFPEDCKKIENAKICLTSDGINFIFNKNIK